jgi:1-deoxy-D-xylulose-5-phosphate synthase
MLYTAFQMNTPAAVRYPRGVGPGVAISKKMQALPLAKGELCRQGKKVAILAFGSLLAPALEAAGELDATVANMRFVKPLDEALVQQLAREHELLVTVEEGTVMGGAGSAVAECLAAAGLVRPLMHLGLPDRFVDHGDSGILLAEVGLDKAGLLAAIRSRLAA